MTTTTSTPVITPDIVKVVMWTPNATRYDLHINDGLTALGNPQTAIRSRIDLGTPEAAQLREEVKDWQHEDWPFAQIWVRPGRLSMPKLEGDKWIGTHWHRGCEWREGRKPGWYTMTIESDDGPQGGEFIGFTRQQVDEAIAKGHGVKHYIAPWWCDDGVEPQQNGLYNNPHNMDWYKGFIFYDWQPTPGFYTEIGDDGGPESGPHMYGGDFVGFTTDDVDEYINTPSEDPYFTNMPEVDEPEPPYPCSACEEGGVHSNEEHQKNWREFWGEPEFDADCPICLRHREHSIAEHEAALRRSHEQGEEE